MKGETTLPLVRLKMAFSALITPVQCNKDIALLESYGCKVKRDKVAGTVTVYELKPDDFDIDAPVEKIKVFKAICTHTGNWIASYYDGPTISWSKPIVP
jgi:hypothetical protein